MYTQAELPPLIPPIYWGETRNLVPSPFQLLCTHKSKNPLATFYFCESETVTLTDIPPRTEVQGFRYETRNLFRGGIETQCEIY